MRFGFDQLGKQIGRKALDLSGPTVVHDEIAPDAHHADLRHEPDPAREAERAQLGLLGRLASVLCLIEIYSRAPDEDEVLTCMGKLIAFRQQRMRAFRKKRGRGAPGPKRAEAFVAPSLWIIAAGRPTGVLAELGATPASDWPAGVYFGPGLLRVGIVVASELPRDRSTLLVRLMAAGPLLPQAVEELRALPRDAPERAVADQILVHLRHVVGKKPRRTPEEKEFIMTMYKTWDDAREEGRAKGEKEGRRREAARNLLTVLEVRGIAVPDDARERILAEKNRTRLERWLKRAILAASIAEVIGEPS